MSKKPTLILIITKLELGGAQKVCLSLFNYFKKQRKTFLIAGSGGILDKEVKKEDSVILIPQLKNSISPKYWIHDVYAFFQLLKIIKREKDKAPNLVVHTHSSKAGILGRWAAFLAGCHNIVHTIHGFGFNSHQNFIKFIMIWLAEFFTNFISTKLIFVSTPDMEYAQKWMLVPQKKCHLIRASAWHLPPPGYTPRKKIHKKTIVIGTVSCFKPQKNLFELLLCFKLLTTRIMQKKHRLNVILKIIGDGNNRKKIEEWIVKNELNHAIQLLGWRSDLTEIYKKLDIFALSSLWEGLPCAVVEALMFKIPVVAYDVGGIKEVVKSGYNGFLVPPNQYILLCDKLELLATNHNLRKKMMTNSKKVPENFYESNLILEHKTLYQ